MIEIMFALLLFCAILAFAAFRLAPMFGGNSQRLETILSDESLADRYKPMARLLREEDWLYLAAQPGFSASQIHVIRSKRRVVFRKYLNCLSGDFASLCLLVRALIIQSHVSRPDLAAALFRSQVAFAVSLLRVEYSLLSHAAGSTVVQVDLSGMLRTLDEIGLQVRGMQSSLQPTFAQAS